MKDFYSDIIKKILDNNTDHNNKLIDELNEICFDAIQSIYIKLTSAKGETYIEDVLKGISKSLIDEKKLLRHFRILSSIIIRKKISYDEFNEMQKRNTLKSSKVIYNNESLKIVNWLISEEKIKNFMDIFKTLKESPISKNISPFILSLAQFPKITEYLILNNCIDYKHYINSYQEQNFLVCFLEILSDNITSSNLKNTNVEIVTLTVLIINTLKYLDSNKSNLPCSIKTFFSLVLQLEIILSTNNV